MKLNPYEPPSSEPQKKEGGPLITLMYHVVKSPSRLLLVVLVAIGHYFAWMFLLLAEAGDGGRWAVLPGRILRFPLVAISRSMPDLPTVLQFAAVALNSLLWGFGMVVLVAWAMRRFREVRAVGRSDAP